MSHSIELKENAIGLRKKGYSIKEVATILSISASTASLWLRNTKITDSGMCRMIEHKELSRYKMSLRWDQKRADLKRMYLSSAHQDLNQIRFTTNIHKVICATLFWAEGAKTKNHVAFTNSDPIMICTFLSTLRKAFPINEAKLHASIHLHEYHNPEEIRDFWSQLTSIPVNRFIKPYMKPHTGKRKKLNYKGCITIRYYDCKIARELEGIYNALGERI